MQRPAWAHGSGVPAHRTPVTEYLACTWQAYTEFTEAIDARLSIRASAMSESHSLKHDDKLGPAAVSNEQATKDMLKELDSAGCKALVGRAKCSLELGEHLRQAIEDCREAAELDPFCYPAYVSNQALEGLDGAGWQLCKARLLLQLGTWDDVRSSLQEAKAASGLSLDMADIQFYGHKVTGKPMSQGDLDEMRLIEDDLVRVRERMKPLHEAMQGAS